VDNILKRPNVLDGLIQNPLSFNNVTPVSTVRRVGNGMEDAIAAVQKMHEKNAEKETKRDAVQIEYTSRLNY